MLNYTQTGLPLIAHKQAKSTNKTQKLMRTKNGKKRQKEEMRKAKIKRL